MTTRNHRIRFMANNFVTSSNVTAYTADASFPLSNAVNTLRHKYYKPTSVTAAWIKVDLGAPYPIGFVSLIAPLGVQFGISQGATLKIQASNIDSWSSPGLDLAMSWSDLGAFRFMDDQSDYTYRFWRFYIDDPLNPTMPKISHIYVGDYTTVTSSNVRRGFVKATIDPSRIQESEGGAFYVNSKTKYAVIQNAGVLNTSAAEGRSLEQFAFDVGISTPFYVSIDPTLVIGSDLNQLTRFVRFQSDPVFQHVLADRFSVLGMNMQEVG